MGWLTLKQKMLLLIIIPLITLLSVITLVINFQLRELGQTQIEELRTELIESKQEALKSYISVALSSVQGIYTHASADDEYAKQRALSVLRELSYGDKGDGYFFVYDKTGVNLANRPSLKLKAKTL